MHKFARAITITHGTRIPIFSVPLLYLCRPRGFPPRAYIKVFGKLRRRSFKQKFPKNINNRYGKTVHPNQSTLRLSRVYYVFIVGKVCGRNTKFRKNETTETNFSPINNTSDVTFACKTIDHFNSTTIIYLIETRRLGLSVSTSSLN